MLPSANRGSMVDFQTVLGSEIVALQGQAREASASAVCIF